MIGVILLSEKWKINPDNIATPIAASLGDVITLGVLSGFSYLFYSVYGRVPKAAPEFSITVITVITVKQNFFFLLETKVWFVGPVVVLVVSWMYFSVKNFSPFQCIDNNCFMLGLGCLDLASFMDLYHATRGSDQDCPEIRMDSCHFRDAH